VIALLRHGTTEDNDGKRVRHTNTPLNDEGRQSAARAAQEMKDLPIKQIFASPLPRAQETAQIWSQVAGVPIKTVPELAARNMGALEGKPVSQVQSILDTLAKRPHVKPPGGGESVADFVNGRYLSAVEPLIKAPELYGVVGHGSGVKAIELGLQQAPLSKWNKEPVIAPGQWAIITPKGLQVHDSASMDTKNAGPESGASS
jgi:broad specificity phosphatase PhoE